MEKSELLLTGVIFIVVFVLAFSLTSWLGGAKADLYGFRIVAANREAPTQQLLASVLNKNRTLLLRQELTNGTSPENSAVAAVASEFIYAVVSSGLKVETYAAIRGVPVNSTCFANNSFCGEPDVVVRIDSSEAPCNCVILNNNATMEITGSRGFLLENSANVRKVIYAAGVAR